MTVGHPASLGQEGSDGTLLGHHCSDENRNEVGNGSEETPVPGKNPATAEATNPVMFWACA